MDLGPPEKFVFNEKPKRNRCHLRGPVPIFEKHPMWVG